MPYIYTKIAKKLRENHLQSLTLDIFDTVLLYRYWPEQQHAIAVAKKWQASLPDLLGTKLSPLELLEWREYAQHELNYLHSAKGEKNYLLDYETWFAQIIDFVAERYSLELDDAKRELIRQTMLRDQLQATAEILKPNTALIQAITELKKALPELKVYFITDEPYSRDQIQYFLDFFKIEIFDGGASGINLQATKVSGELYRKIESEKTFAENFAFKTNLHIGDSRPDDVLPLRKLDGQVLAYRPIRARTLRTLAGSLDASVKLHPAFDLFGDRRSAELSRLGFLAKNVPEQIFLLASEQADEFKFQGITLLPQSFSGSNIVTAPVLDQKALTAALTWLLISRADQRWNLRAIVSLILALDHPKSKLSPLEKRRQVYSFCFGAEYPASDLILTHRSEEEFLEALLQDFVTVDPRYTEHLREAYASVASFLPRNDAKVLLIDTDPTQATARLFHEFAKLHGLDNPIAGFTISK